MPSSGLIHDSSCRHRHSAPRYPARPAYILSSEVQNADSSSWSRAVRRLPRATNARCRGRRTAFRSASPGLAPSPNSRQSEPGLSEQIRRLPGRVRRARGDLQNRVDQYAGPPDDVRRYLTALPAAAAQYFGPSLELCERAPASGVGLVWTSTSTVTFESGRSGRLAVATVIAYRASAGPFPGFVPNKAFGLSRAPGCVGLDKVPVDSFYVSYVSPAVPRILNRAQRPTNDLCGPFAMTLCVTAKERKITTVRET